MKRWSLSKIQLKGLHQLSIDAGVQQKSLKHIKFKNAVHANQLINCVFIMLYQFLCVAHITCSPHWCQSLLKQIFQFDFISHSAGKYQGVCLDFRSQIQFSMNPILWPFGILVTYSKSSGRGAHPWFGSMHRSWQYRRLRWAGHVWYKLFGSCPWRSDTWRWFAFRSTLGEYFERTYTS